MIKKSITLFITSIFVFGLGMAYAEEETILNPWERNVQSSAKKTNKAKTAIKTNKKETRNSNVEKTKKTNIAKAEKTSIVKAKRTNTEKTENTSAVKAEKKETGQKKKFLFW